MHLPDSLRKDAASAAHDKWEAVALRPLRALLLADTVREVRVRSATAGTAFLALARGAARRCQR